MRHIKLSATKRKKANTMHIGNEDFRDLMVRDDLVVDDLVDLEVDNDELTSEILTLAILWVVFLVVDLADDEGKKAPKGAKTYRSL
jgi:hypothetical protein